MTADGSNQAPPSFITAVASHQTVEASSDIPVPWWSFTKTALAAAALALIARGRLDLDAPILRKPFTLRELLQHRSGLPDYGTLPGYHKAVASGEAPWAVPDMLARAGAEEPVRRPGEAFAYSNIGYLLVRRLIEEVCALPIAAAVAELVLAPLGLSGVAFAASPEDLARTAWGNPDCYDPGWVYHGLLFGPASEAALLLHRLLAGALLPQPLLHAMCTPEPVFTSEPGRPWLSVGYGMGLGICRAEGGVFAGHTGAGPGSVSAVYQLVDGQAAARRTAAVFAPLDSPGAVEREALKLAAA